jgi:D-alanyl-D-alanine carboxypeptidase/D-alanyl-D-alanine-endopeptidase (penicillin-binding protein 4)
LAPALLLVLFAACGRQASAEVLASDGAGLAGRAPTVAAAPARVGEDPTHAARSAKLTADARALVARHVERARIESKGKAHGNNVRVAVCLRELGAGEELVALRADAPQPPASNLKLVTTAAALILLGPGAEWVTPFESSARLADGVLAGDLVLRAAGDPLCDPDNDGAAEARVLAAARALAEAGVRRIAGDLVLDEGDFAAPEPGPSWPDASQRWAEYCALAGGFSVNGGVLHARVAAGAVGKSASLAIHPRAHGLESSYGVKTVAGSAVDVRVGATATTATVKGTIGAKLGAYEAEFAHPDPVLLFGAVLQDALRAAGITLDGTLVRRRGVPRGKTLAELRSALAESLAPINAESRNSIADQLFFSLGHALVGAGTRAGGARAVTEALARLGVPREDLVQVDGSGLSRDNRVSARAVTALLERVLGADPAAARLYQQSLAVMGAKGTLETRLKGTAAEGRVFAKTGWISGVSALSGYLVPEHGRPSVFSILIEYPSEIGGLNTSAWKPLQDELVLLFLGGGA